MLEYLIAIAALSVLALLLRVIYTRWYRYLLRLSERYDVRERRRVASRHLLIVVLMTAGAMAAALFPLILYTRVPSLAIVIGFGLAVSPNVVWWLRRTSALKALGY